MVLKLRNLNAPAHTEGAIRDINPDMIKKFNVMENKLIVESDMQDSEPFHCKPPFPAKVLSVCQMYSATWLPL